MHAAAALSLGKASADDPVHPGWPAGTPGGLGGKFRPKDAGEKAVRRQALRRAIRALLLQAATLPPEIAANLLPVLGAAADIAMVAQLAKTSLEFINSTLTPRRRSISSQADHIALQIFE
jgi:hypothetical protein